MDQLDTQVVKEAPHISKTAPETLVGVIIADARRAWALDDQWRIEWEWTTEGDGRQASNTSIDCTHLTEKWTKIRVDARLKSKPNDLQREIFHELGHLVVAPIWRSMSDFASVHLAGSERESYEEAVNSAENVVIDHVVFQIMGVQHG